MTETYWGISETKRYNKILKVIIMDMESGLELIIECDTKVVERVANIYLGDIL